MTGRLPTSRSVLGTVTNFSAVLIHCKCMIECPRDVEKLGHRAVGIDKLFEEETDSNCRVSAHDVNRQKGTSMMILATFAKACGSADRSDKRLIQVHLESYAFCQLCKPRKPLQMLQELIIEVPFLTVNIMS